MPLTFEMYHGTSLAAADQIMQNGFKASSDGYLGKGVYGGYEAKARAFAANGRHGGDEGALIRCRVTVDESKVKTVHDKANATQKNGKQAEAVWYPGGGSVKRPEVCITDTSKIEILGIERVKVAQRSPFDYDCDSDTE